VRLLHQYILKKFPFTRIICLWLGHHSLGCELVFDVACRKQWHINPININKFISGEITYRL